MPELAECIYCGTAIKGTPNYEGECQRSDDGLHMPRRRLDRWRCVDCGYTPVGAGRPPINTCPRCRGDFTWSPLPTTS